MDTINTLTELKLALRLFAKERNWEPFHTPKNLAASVMIEAGELLEHFQWISQEESNHLAASQKQEVAHEIADVLIYLTRLADTMDIDPIKAVAEKMQLNAIKYPKETEKKGQV